MKIFKIRSGKVKDDTKNFTGFTMKKDQIFFPAKLVTDILATLEADDEGRIASIPSLYCIAEQKTYNSLDENDDPILDDDGNEVTFTRMEALFCSTDKGLVQDAYNEENDLTDEAEDARLTKRAARLGLDKSKIGALLKASVNA